MKAIKNGRAERNSSVELLKVIAILMIIISHSIPRYGSGEAVVDFNIAATGVTPFILCIEYYFGQIGNAVFFVCSAWFLVDSSNTSAKKIKNIVVDVFFISVCWLIVLSFMGFDFGVKTVLKQLMPITFENNWFVGCYLVVYAIHPVVNQAIRNISQKTHLKLVIGGIFLYSCLEFIYSSVRYCMVIGFLLIYMIVGYIKRYMPNFCQDKKKNIILFFLSSGGLLALLAVTNQLGLHIAAFSDQMLRWSRFNNPLIILMGLSAFLIFHCGNFQNKYINGISSVSLLIYVLHENNLFRDYVKPVWWQYIYDTFSYRYVVAWTLVFAVACFAGGELPRCCTSIPSGRFYIWAAIGCLTSFLLGATWFSIGFCDCSDRKCRSAWEENAKST